LALKYKLRYSFEKQQIREGGLRAFNLRRQQRLLAYIGIEKKRRVGQDASDAVEPAESSVGSFDQVL